MRFDRVIVVDWSAAAQPSPARPSADAIWIGEASAAGEEVSYHRTRRDAEAVIRQRIGRGDRVLIGFDFPMGYPSGFAERLTGRRSATAVREWLAAAIQDGPDNRNNRFAVAAGINRMFGAEGPFWGCPAACREEGLRPRKTFRHQDLGLAERRAVEMAVPRAQPVWKLFTTGSVGSQVLTGLPALHRLGLPVWPFDPPEEVMAAEVYPSLLAARVAREGGIRDAAQVRLLSRALFRLSQADRLAPLFDVPPVAAEEGWILGAGHAAALEGALAW